MKRIYSAMIMIFCLILSCVSVVSYVYKPDDLILDPTIENFNLPENFEETFIETNSKKNINAIYDLDIFSNNYCILFLHGNGDTIWSDGMKEIYMQLILNNLSVFAIDYKGYGKSEGISRIITLLEDVEAGYEYLENNYSDKNIIIWGKSLGTIPAIQLAQKHPESILVLESTISNINDLEIPLEKLFSTSLKNVDLIIEDDHSFNNVEEINKIKNRVYMIHGRDDSIALYKIAQDMFKLIPSKNKKFITLENEGHNFSSFEILEIPVGIILEDLRNGVK